MILTFFGLLYTGMGHGTGTSVFLLLALLPIPLIYWAIIGLLLCWVRRRAIRIIIVCLLLLHYSTFVFYSYINLTNSQYEDFFVVWQRDPSGTIAVVLFYLTGQFVIWGSLIFSKPGETFFKHDGKIENGSVG